MPPTARGQAWKMWLAEFALGVLTWLAYANSFTAGLVLDNSIVIGEDTRIRQWNHDNLYLIFTRNYWWPLFESDLYRPLTTLSYLINYAVLGNEQNPVGYHVVNFVLHCANVVLVLVIVRRLAGRLDLAVLAAAIFAVHPVNVESVTNIVGRADLLATLCILLGGWCYMRAAETRGIKKVAWLTGMGLNALWGIFAKESALMICLFVFFYDLVWRWPQVEGPSLAKRLGRAAWEFGAKGYVALAPAVVALWAVRHWLTFNSPVFGQIFVDNPISQPDSWLSGFLTAIKVIGRYLQLLVFPHRLSSDYSYNQIPLYGEPGHFAQDIEAWVALGVVVGLIGLAVAWRRTQPLFAWGVGLFFLMQLLTANLLFPIGSIMGERFLYLPSVGFAVVAAQAILWLGAKLARAAGQGPRGQSVQAWVLATLVVAAFGVRTYVRNFDWQDELSLWRSAVQNAPDSFKSYKGYSNAILAAAMKDFPQDTAKQEEALDHAIAVSETGLRILDSPPLALPKEDETLYQDLGNFYRLKGDYLHNRQQPEEARQYYEKSLAVLLRAQRVDHWVSQTSHQSSLDRGRPEHDIPTVGNYRVYIHLEQTYERLTDWTTAEAAARHIELLVPTEGIGYRLCGTDLFYQGKLRQAAAQLLEAGLLDNSDAAAWLALGNCYTYMGLPPGTLRRNGPNNVLDITNPEVREDLNEACVGLVQEFLDGKQYDNARMLRDRFVKNYHVPAELFPQL
jgi:tetratricopeptide (TPR) repeat protein